MTIKSFLACHTRTSGLASLALVNLGLRAKGPMGKSLFRFENSLEVLEMTRGSPRSITQFFKIILHT